jgi:hypothetical protein
MLPLLTAWAITGVVSVAVLYVRRRHLLDDLERRHGKMTTETKAWVFIYAMATGIIGGPLVLGCLLLDDD